LKKNKGDKRLVQSIYKKLKTAFDNLEKLRLNSTLSNSKIQELEQTYKDIETSFGVLVEKARKLRPDLAPDATNFYITIKNHSLEDRLNKLIKELNTSLSVAQQIGAVGEYGAAAVGSVVSGLEISVMEQFEADALNLPDTRMKQGIYITGGTENTRTIDKSKFIGMASHENFHTTQKEYDKSSKSWVTKTITGDKLFSEVHKS
jgi:hypothetical protein